jgi:hypothetical protein
MTTEENKAIARRFVEVLQEFFRTGEPDLLDSVLADNVVQHLSGQPPEAHSLLRASSNSSPPCRKPFPTFSLQPRT